jgi:DNA replication protein DnaD
MQTFQLNNYPDERQLYLLFPLYKQRLDVISLELTTRDVFLICIYSSCNELSPDLPFIVVLLLINCLANERPYYTKVDQSQNSNLISLTSCNITVSKLINLTILRTNQFTVCKGINL